MSRAAFFRFHSWLGLATGAFMIIIAWSGSVAVFNDEIGWLVTPELRANPAAGVRPLDDVLSALRQRFPDTPFDLHIQAGPHWAHTAYVYEAGITTYVHIDPATAQITRADVMDGYTWNLVYFIRQLHVRLLMGRWGRVFVGLFGVTLVLSIVTSLWIYREWLRSLVRLRRHQNPRIFHMDLHKMVGAWTLVINLMFGITGAVLGIENLYYSIWPANDVVENTGAPPPVTRIDAGLSPGRAAAMLARMDPHFMPTVVQYAPHSSIVAIRGDHPGALIAKDQSVYRVDLASGTVLEGSRDARRAAWPTYLYNMLDPLHFGYFGDKWGNTASYAIKVAWCLLGLTPGFLSLTGGYMWWLRRQRSRAAAAARDRARVRAQMASPRPAPVFTWYGAGLAAFLSVGYVLQAVVWNRGWGMSELLWQHWIVKPICLIAVAFPLTLAAVVLGRSLLRLAWRDNRPAAALLASLPLGLLYLTATSVLN